MLEQWVLVEGAFHAVFGVDLSEALHVKSWRWFWTRVMYLLRDDNALSRYFAPKPDAPAEEMPNFDL